MIMHEIELGLRWSAIPIAALAAGGEALGLLDLVMVAAIVAAVVLTAERALAMWRGFRSESVQAQLLEHTHTWLATAQEIERAQRALSERISKIEGTCMAMHSGAHLEPKPDTK